MGTPVRRDALTPNDLQYYAPRKLRDGDPPSIPPSPATDEPQNLHTSGNSRSKDSAPLPEIFPSSRENSDQVAPRPRRAGHPRLKTLAMVAGAAVIGVVVGVAVLDAIQGQSEPPPAKVPDVPLAARLQTATSDLQKTSQPVVLPQLTLSDSIGDANVPLKLGVEVKNYTADATVDLSGLPAGTVLSTGSARGDGQWRIIVDDLPKTRVTPPRDYVGLMTLTAEVRGNGQAIVRGPVRLTWRQIPAAPDTVGVRTPNAGLPVAGNVATPKIEPRSHRKTSRHRSRQRPSRHPLRRQRPRQPSRHASSTQAKSPHCCGVARSCWRTAILRLPGCCCSASPKRKMRRPRSSWRPLTTRPRSRNSQTTALRPTLRSPSTGMSARGTGDHLTRQARSRRLQAAPPQSSR